MNANQKPVVTLIFALVVPFSTFGICNATESAIPGVYTPVLAQMILRSELGSFRCSLRIQTRAETVTVLSPSVEQWNVGPSNISSGSSAFFDRKQKRYEFSYIESLSPLREAGSSALVIVPLQLTNQNQFQKHLLSFWEVQGDSLSLVHIMKNGRVASPGKFQLGEPRKVGDTEFVVFSESANVDAGDVWGTAEIISYDMSNKFAQTVYSANYSWQWCALSDTLSITWSIDSKLVAQVVRRVVQGDQELPTGMECRNITVSADTSFVDLGPLQVER